MAIVEEIGQGAGGSGYIWSSLDELLQSLVKLSKDLALPDILVSGFMKEVDGESCILTVYSNCSE